MKQTINAALSFAWNSLVTGNMVVVEIPDGSGGVRARTFLAGDDLGDLDEVVADCMGSGGALFLPMGVDLETPEEFIN